MYVNIRAFFVMAYKVNGATFIKTKNKDTYMKKSYLINKTILIIFLFAVVSCQSSTSKKLKDAKADVIEADENIKVAQDDYLDDMDNFKKETKTQISENQKSINEFKAPIAEGKKEAKADYDDKVNALEQKNSDMKRRMDEYKLEGKDHWNSFKKEFNHDMDELGKALKDLTVNNE